MRRQPRSADFPSPLLRLFPRVVHPDFTVPVYFERRATPRNRVWRLLLGALVWNYDLVTVERVVEIPWVFQNLGLPPGARILDFGCSQSPIALHLASLGYHVVGVDLRPYDFTHPNLRVLQGDFLESGFAEGEFDAVVAISAIEHTGLAAYGELPRERADHRIVAEFSRVLRGGGRLLLTVPYGRQGQTSWYRVYDCETLAALLAPFMITKIDYYAGVGRTAWHPVAEEEAARVDSVTPARTHAIACVRAVKA
jgi:SAM-dependent methyltransferase